MNQDVLTDIAAEIHRAREKHPDWPDDEYKCLAIIGEEFGELQKAKLEYDFGNVPYSDIYEEGVHAAAMIIRFLANLKGDKSSIITVCPCCGKGEFWITLGKTNKKRCTNCGVGIGGYYNETTKRIEPIKVLT